MAQVGLKELLEAGVHFGHQTRRWNPKMRRFIFGERDGIYLIDLLQTEAMLENARRFAGDLARRGGVVLFVGTKKQARDAIKESAEAAGMPYVNHRWLGGLLTNFQTISNRIKRLHDLERYEAEGQLQLLPTRERMAAQADLAKLRANLGGVKNMQRPPDAVFVIDLKTEAIAVKEAQRLRIPLIGLVDTNCDPEGIDFVIPGNDDAIRSCAAVAGAIGDVVAAGYSIFRAEEEAARLERERREAEERARREAEEQARREAEEKARAEAEEKARQEAEEQARREAEEQARQEAAAAEAAQEAAQAAPAEQATTPTISDQERQELEAAQLAALQAAKAAAEAAAAEAPAETAAETAAASEAPAAEAAATSAAPRASAADAAATSAPEPAAAPAPADPEAAVAAAPAPAPAPETAEAAADSEALGHGASEADAAAAAQPATAAATPAAEAAADSEALGHGASEADAAAAAATPESSKSETPNTETEDQAK